MVSCSQENMQYKNNIWLLNTFAFMKGFKDKTRLNHEEHEGHEEID